MSQTVQSRPLTPTTRPRRRVAVAAAGFLTCALPTVWTLNLSRMLLTGELSEHRFHQLTGQGLMLTALWLSALVPLVVAGWRGRRPSTASGLLHLCFVGAGLGAAVVAPQGGALSLGIVIAVTGGLLWLALPHRPRLGRVELAPVALASALLLSAAAAPYAVGQIDLQHAATGHHAHNPHYFDMAWLVITFAVAAVVGSVVVSARRLLVWAGAGSVLTGLAMLAFDQGVVQATALLFTGAAVLAARAATRDVVGEFAGQRPAA